MRGKARPGKEECAYHASRGGQAPSRRVGLHSTWPASLTCFRPVCLDLREAQKLPEDRRYDGVSLARLLREAGPSSRSDIFYYYEAELFAVRRGPWKLHLKTINPAAGETKPNVPVTRHFCSI